MTLSRFYIISLIGLSLGLSCGCSKSLNNFKTFAQAGERYTEALVALSEEASHAAIDADSEILLQSRQPLNEIERGEVYQAQTEALTGLFLVISDLKKHTLLLKKYFSTLADLTDPEISENLAQQASGILTEIKALSPKLEQAEVGGVSVKDLVPKTSTLIVGTFQWKALQAELRRNGPTIAKELDLQDAVLQALAAQMENDLDIIFKGKGYREILLPYTSAEPIPEHWTSRRREALSAYANLASVENAKAATSTLRDTFTALVENKPVKFETLFAQINAIIELTELVQSTQPKE